MSGRYYDRFLASIQKEIWKSHRGRADLNRFWNKGANCKLEFYGHLKTSLSEENQINLRVHLFRENKHFS